MKVSVIITTFNHGVHIGAAIASVQQQTVRPYEIIVVDDGSTDDTFRVVETYGDVKYYYQDNQGLSSARNAGLKLASGDALLFLDADDWLLPRCIEIQSNYLASYTEIAFVSGAHKVFFEQSGEVWLGQRKIDKDNYLAMLEGNYIGMHAAVMYRSWAFQEINFDVTLSACEDYDVYLKMTRKFKVHHHQELVAVYRIHDSNMSSRKDLMLKNSLLVLERQRSFGLNPQQLKSLNKGKRFWHELYNNKPESGKSNKRGFLAGIFSKFSIQRYERQENLKVYYAQTEFLRSNKNLVNGVVLENYNNQFTYQFGGLGVTESVVFDGTLSGLENIREAFFDTILLMDCCQNIAMLEEFLRTCFTLMKPGGHLLLTNKTLKNTITPQSLNSLLQKHHHEWLVLKVDGKLQPDPMVIVAALTKIDPFS